MDIHREELKRVYIHLKLKLSRLLKFRRDIIHLLNMIRDQDGEAKIQLSLMEKGNICLIPDIVTDGKFIMLRPMVSL